MESLIIYKSNTGFTKRYVDSLERRILDSKVVDIKDLRKSDLKEAKFIFYGGPLKNDKIDGLDKFLKYYDLVENKNIFIFCTGISPLDDKKKENVILANGLNLYHVRLYLLPGGFDFNKMSKFEQKMIKLGLKMQAEKQGFSKDLIESRLNSSVDLVDLNKLDRMVEVYHAVKLKEQKA